MPHRKSHAKFSAPQQRDHHRQLLVAALFLGGVLLILNAWLVSQNVLDF